MCLTVRDSSGEPLLVPVSKNMKDPIPCIAEKNMVVYKVGHIWTDDPRIFVSVFRGFPYTQGEVTDNIDIHLKWYPIEVGCYTGERRIPDTIYAKWFADEGYHSYNCYDTAQKTLEKITPTFNEETVGVFIIPKGAKYFLGTCDEIVSSELTYVTKYNSWKALPNFIKKCMVKRYGK